MKIYYNDGQHAITQMLNGAIEYAIAKDAYLFKEAHPQDYRLSQVADYLCGIELTAIKYEQRESTATDDTIFGGSTSFKKNYLRKIRKKQL